MYFSSASRINGEIAVYSSNASRINGEMAVYSSNASHTNGEIAVYSSSASRISGEMAVLSTLDLSVPPCAAPVEMTGLRDDGLSKLFQESQVVVQVVSQVIYAVSQHCQAIRAHTKRKTCVLF